jgi:hypothetical protein
VRRGGWAVGATVVGVADAELGAVLVCAGVVADQLDTVAARVRLEIGGWCPDVGARVLDVLDDRVQWDHVVGRAA